MPNSSSYVVFEGIITSDDNKLPISYIGFGVLHVHNNYLFSINNLLHTPKDSINLLYVQKLYANNFVFIEFHSSSFYVKEYTTNRVLFQGRITGVVSDESLSASFDHVAGEVFHLVIPSLFPVIGSGISSLAILHLTQ